MSREILYHGSNIAFDSIDLSKSRDKRDFGRGFYMTTIKTQAEQWANTLYKRYSGDGKFLYTFEFDMAFELVLKEFSGLTFDWLEMVKENRINGGISHSYDVVKGPVANDNTMPTIALYVDGTLSVEAALIELKYFKANDQVSIHTEKSLRNIKMIGREEL